MNRTEATQILMLSSDATFDDIKYAYRKLSLKLHPDRNKNEKDGRRFKNVLEAYHFLKGQNRLKNYNDRNKSTTKTFGAIVSQLQQPMHKLLSTSTSKSCLNTFA